MTPGPDDFGRAVGTVQLDYDFNVISSTCGVPEG